MQRIYNILVSFLGESKQGGFFKDTMQYQFNSPWSSEENFGIPDNKYNLEVSLSLGKYHEWVTDYGGNISKLIRKFGTREQLQDYYNIIKELNTILEIINAKVGEEDHGGYGFKLIQQRLNS